MEISLNIFCPHCEKKILLKSWSTLETCPHCGIPISSRNFKVLQHRMPLESFLQELEEILEFKSGIKVNITDHIVLMPSTCWTATVAYGKNKTFEYTYPEVFTAKAEAITHAISELFGEHAAYVYDKMGALFKSHARVLDAHTIWMKITSNFMPESELSLAVMPPLYENVYGANMPENMHELARGACCETLSAQEQELAVNAPTRVLWNPTLIPWRVGELDYEESPGHIRKIKYIYHYSDCAKYVEIFDENNKTVYFEHIPPDYSEQLHKHTTLRNPISTVTYHDIVLLLPWLLIIPVAFMLNILTFDYLKDYFGIFENPEGVVSIIYGIYMLFYGFVMPFIELFPYLWVIEDYVLADDKCKPKEDIGKLQKDWETQYNAMQSTNVAISDIDSYLNNDFLKSQAFWEDKMRTERVRKSFFARRYLKGMLACIPKYVFRYFLPIYAASTLLLGIIMYFCK